MTKTQLEVLRRNAVIIASIRETLKFFNTIPIVQPCEDCPACEAYHILMETAQDILVG